jgi:hypothetical protein
LEAINLNAAGIDIGSTEHYVAVPPGRSSETVRTFGSYTAALYEMACWLKECGVTSVAMESTGSYWIAPYQVLEASGFEVILVNSRHVKNLPGRKSNTANNTMTPANATTKRNIAITCFVASKNTPLLLVSNFLRDRLL